MIGVPVVRILTDEWMWVSSVAGTADADDARTLDGYVQQPQACGEPKICPC